MENNQLEPQVGNLPVQKILNNQEVNQIIDFEDVDMISNGQTCNNLFSQSANDSAFNQSATSQFNQSIDSLQLNQTDSTHCINRSTSSQFNQTDSLNQSTSFTSNQSFQSDQLLSNTTDKKESNSKDVSNLSSNLSDDISGQISCSELADCLLKNNVCSSRYYVLIDSRSFIEYNNCHIQEAVNICCSKIIKRRLQNNKTTVRELLNNVNNRSNLDNAALIVVYDQSSSDITSLPDDSCLKVLWTKLVASFKNARFLKGGFGEFHQNYNALCTNKAQLLQNRQKKSSMDAISQPCLTNIGPTRILPFLYLGSQVDAMNQEVLKSHNITYELNVSTTCPKPDFIQDSHFLRIPVNDNYSDKLLPYFPQAINFLDKVRESSGCVLVHCLGGISRSATVAIAYIMHSMKMSSDDAYRYLKAKRATISPNFNFLGQLLEYEKQLIDLSILSAKTGENSLLKLTKERQDNGDSDYLQPLTPSFCDLNNKTFTSSSPKHHVLHHHFNPHLMNQEKRSNNLNDSINTNSGDSEELTIDGTGHNLINSSNVTFSNSVNCSTSQFTNLNCAQKRTCSFSSSPNTRNKMTLKLQVNENENLGSIVFM